MNKIFSILLIVIGLFLVLYFGYVFIIFSSSKNPLILPIIAKPILYSIILMGLGLIILVIGIVTMLKTYAKRSSSNEQKS
jgi:uncharacterized membrane protein